MWPKDLSLALSGPTTDLFSRELRYISLRIYWGAVSFLREGVSSSCLLVLLCIHILRNSNISKDTKWHIQSIHNNLTHFVSAVKSNFSTFDMFAFELKIFSNSIYKLEICSNQKSLFLLWEKDIGGHIGQFFFYTSNLLQSGPNMKYSWSLI